MGFKMQGIQEQGLYTHTNTHTLTNNPTNSKRTIHRVRSLLIEGD